jgi:O-acetyl-ADP-ribose deacetylase (regulator of RNase III)
VPQILVEGGDIVLCEVDAIVNAANHSLLGGGGVDGAIHRAAGPELLAACRAIPEVSPGVRCPTGEARITPGFRLPAKYVVHTVGPVFVQDPDPDAALASAYVSSLALAAAHGVRTIAFPAIACGAYGFPLPEAASIAVAAARRSEMDVVRFVLREARAYEAWQRALRA